MFSTMNSGPLLHSHKNNVESPFAWNNFVIYSMIISRYDSRESQYKEAFITICVCVNEP